MPEAGLMLERKRRPLAFADVKVFLLIRLRFAFCRYILFSVLHTHFCIFFLLHSFYTVNMFFLLSLLPIFFALTTSIVAIPSLKY